MSLHHGLRSAAGASVADPDFKNVSLLLLGNGSNGGQNNTFTDGSSNAFSITRYGNTTQGTFSPFGYNWSNYFDGSGDYLSGPTDNAFKPGTGDFTVEAWIYPTGNGSNASGPPGIFDCRISGNEAGGFWFGLDSSYKLLFYTNTPLLTASTACSLNTWQHVAVTRSGSTVTLWLNGSSVGTLTNSTNFTTGGCYIGMAYTGSNNPFMGNISNLRFLKGTAQYSSAFTPPTAPLTAITNTSLLTCQSNRFIDNSSNAFTITPYGNASVTNFAPFATGSEYSTGTNGGSGYFDGSGDYLTVADSTAFDLTGDFTLELFFYPTAWDNSWSIGLGSENSGQNGFTFYANGTSNMGVYGNGAHIIQVSCDAKLYEWNHLALVRSGSTLTLYLNGVSKGTATNSTSFTGITANGFSLGAVYTSTLRVDNPKGYCSSLRLAKSAVYTAAFTPPTSPLTAITNTSLLLNFTNASIIDSTGKNDLETVGDAQISTSTKKYGTGSIKLDGAGDYLSLPSSSALSFGTGDFTIECWAYVLGTADAPNYNNYGAFADFRTANASQVNVLWSFLNGSAPIFYVNGSTRITGSNITLNTWTHLALCRSSGVTKMFMDGTQVGSSYTDTNNYTSTVARIGGNINGDSFLYAYLDDYRISKTARYTAAFTPPSRQLPAR